MLEATALWWRIQLDPDSRALDDEFSTSVERAIRTTDAWTVRAPDDAEAWFYLGGAYAARVQWRVLRERSSRRRATASASKKRSNARWRSIPTSTTPTSASACIGTTPTSRRRPPGSSDSFCCCPAAIARKGWRRCCGPAARGRLLQGEADYQLHVVYLWYEHQTGRALELLRGLQQQSSRQSALPDTDRRDSGRLSARRHGEPRQLARAARAGARRPRQRRQASPRCGRGSASPAISTRSRSPTKPSTTSAASSPSSPTRRMRRSRWRTCGSAKRTTA